MHTNDLSIYKYPLHEARDFQDLRDMSEYVEKTFADKTAYLIKDPVALRKVDPRTASKKELSWNPNDDYTPISYKQFHKDRKALGTALKNLGVQAEDKVVILSETRYEWYVSYLATVCGLAIVTPLDKELPANEIATLIERSRATTIIYSGGQRDKLESIYKDLPTLRNFVAMDLPSDEDFAKGVHYFWDLVDEANESRVAGDVSYDTLPIDPDILSILLFTSGTTAKSKAVMLSHRNICQDLTDIVRMVEFSSDDTSVSILPLHHTLEATAGFLLIHSKGATVAVNDGLRHMTTNFKQAKASVVIGVPLVLESVHRSINKKIDSDEKTRKKFNFALKLSKFLKRIGIDVRKKLFSSIHDGLGGHMRLIVVGGAAIEPTVLDFFNNVGFLAFQGYGLTETAPVIAVNRPDHKKAASAGLPFPHADIKIINEDADGIGEIIASGPYVMLGYYEDEELTKEAIDENGYYHTGDYGYIDEDNFVYITGRKANIIVTQNGKNIFPEEIEFVLENNSKLIQEVVVYGVRDASGDQEITAEVFPNEEYLKENPETANLALASDELLKLVEADIKEANQLLVPYKRVRTVHLRTEPFERNTSKKILRHKHDQVNIDK